MALPYVRLAWRCTVRAIDDFGTDYSSLSYLQRFPIDVLKIDKSFVDGVAKGGSDTALTRTILALGEMLGLRTLGGGVETAEQCAELREVSRQPASATYLTPPMRAGALFSARPGVARLSEWDWRYTSHEFALLLRQREASRRCQPHRS